MDAMIKKWEIKSSPAPQFPDRKLLLMSSEGRADAYELKKSFRGYIGVVLKSDTADFQWQAYVYGASANIEKLINQELKELSAESGTAPVGKKLAAPTAKPAEKKEIAPEKKKTAPTEAPAAVKEPEAEPEKIEFPEKTQKPEGKISADAQVAAAKKPADPTKIAKEEKPAAPEKEVGAPAPAIEQFEKKSSPDAKAAGGVSELLETFEKPSSEKKEEPVSPSGEKKADKAEKPVAPKTADAAAVTEKAAPAAAPVIEKFEQFTPDQSSAKPLAGPLIETFAGAEKTAVQQEKTQASPEKETEAEKPEVTPARKDAKPIDVLYLCPESGRDKADLVKENIAKIVTEKNINFDFKSAGVVAYQEGATKESVMEEIAKYKFSFVLVVAPDSMGEELLREIKKKGFVPKVITEDNIDKKFRYLNLITDIVLSPRR